MAKKKTKAVVIGAGPGGYVAAIRLGQLGVETLLVEKGELGGVCLNVGCIPSKALIHGAKLADKMRHSDDLGISAAQVSVDMGKMQKWKSGVVKKLTGGVGALCKANNVKILRGEAVFQGPNLLRVSGKENHEVEFEHAIIATGSRPTEIPPFPFDSKHILDSTGALSLEQIPKSMLVIGGGYIGLELGGAYAKLGAEVTVIEAMDSILPSFDPEIVRVLQRRLKKLGIKIQTNVKAKGHEIKRGLVHVTAEDKKGEELTYQVEKVLVAVGRRPNLDGWGRENLDLAMTDDGFIQVDDERRTSVPNIFAIGDIAGQPLLAHKASYEGEVAAEVIAGKKAAFDPGAIPAVVFTDPEIATTGLSEQEAKDEGYDVIVGKMPFAAIGRALTTNDTDGFVKIIGDKETGLVLGVHIIGNGASDMVSEGTAAIELGSTVEDLALSIHPHPSLSEGVMEAAKNALGAAIHTVNR